VSADSPALLRAAGVTVTKGGKRILADFGLELHRGEIAALLGPNGAGKTTLVRALAELEPAAAGTVRIEGRVAAALQSPALARRSVLANVKAALSWWGVDRVERGERAIEALRSVGAAHLADRQASQLSGGEARRVHLARVLALKPDVLLLDEPFAGLDPVNRAALLYDVAGALRDPHRATLVVVHDRAEAWALADRVLVMIDGRLAASGTPQEVLESPRTLEVAEFVGFTGRIEDGHEIIALRPRDVRVDERGRWSGTVVRKTPVEDGVRLDLDLAEGRLVATVPPPGPEIGERLRVQTVGGVRFPRSAAALTAGA
jgi:ABC-type Fe3+/spermidine/putrescine transport system ATPase subunit